MKIGLYINTNKVGLQFGTEKDRDTFWNAMGAKANGSAAESAEKFGQRSIRLHPEHFRARLMWTMDIENLSPDIVSPVTEIKIKAGDVTAPAKVEPVTILKEPEPVAPAVVTTAVSVPIPEISNVASVADPEPKDKRTRAHREWAARNRK